MVANAGVESERDHGRRREGTSECVFRAKIQKHDLKPGEAKVRDSTLLRQREQRDCRITHQPPPVAIMACRKHARKLGHVRTFSTWIPGNSDGNGVLSYLKE